MRVKFTTDAFIVSQNGEINIVKSGTILNISALNQDMFEISLVHLHAIKNITFKQIKKTDNNTIKHSLYFVCNKNSFEIIND